MGSRLQAILAAACSTRTPCLRSSIALARSRPATSPSSISLCALPDGIIGKQFSRLVDAAVEDHRLVDVRSSP